MSPTDLIPFADHWPMTDQLREDAALGAAWRRAEAALPEGWGNGPTLFGYDTQPSGRYYIASVDRPRRRGARRVFISGDAATPVEALEALAAALEAR